MIKVCETLDLERTTFDAGEKKRTGKMMEIDE